MTFRAEIHARARGDIDRHLRSIDEHVSPDFADEWSDGLSAAIASLSRLPERCVIAPESTKLNLEIRHLLHGRRPHVYRVFFVILDRRVLVLRVRHGAQAPLTRSDITLPRGNRP